MALLLCGCGSPHVLRPFTTDGCSLFPDSAGDACWANCCVEHDRAYWRGGTAEERSRADRDLRQCVAQVGEPRLADLMYWGVRLGGMPLLPTWYRWGYGWSYGRGYEPLTPDGVHQADRLLQTHQPARPDPDCPTQHDR